MSEIHIREEGRAGRITLTRPEALNAVSYEMCLAIEAALVRWRDDAGVALVVIDALGEKAFSAGGDIQKMYETGRAGDYGYGRRFWRDEYRLNAMIADYPKPYVALMQGFTMGGGVGISCHGSHRIVGETSQIAMPECAIGLVPDVGGSWLLGRAPGRLGEYLGLTGARMGPGDAMLAGFADFYVPQMAWPELIARLCAEGDVAAIADVAETPPEAALALHQAEIDALFAGEGLGDILSLLTASDSPFAAKAQSTMARNSPLSMAATVALVQQARGADIRKALELEFRFTYRAMEHGDFIEGIRAQVIDKDRAPRWRHRLDDPPLTAAMQMLRPLGAERLRFDEGQKR